MKLFAFPQTELEFVGNKKPYDYFNIINEKCEKKSWHDIPLLRGELLSTEPLQYKFYSDFFPNNKVPQSFKTSIIVTLENSAEETRFIIKTKAGVPFWILCSIFSFTFLLEVYKTIFEKHNIGTLFSPAIFIVAFYSLEFYILKRLIRNFRNEVHA